MNRSDGPTPRPTACVVLAAGKGTRMRSRTPKVLHEIAGLSMLGHVLGVVAEQAAERVIVVVGHGSEAVEAEARRLAPDVDTPVQSPQLGTAHAVAQARAALDGFAGDVFVLFGDTPLLRPETLAAMAEARATGAGVVVLGFDAADPTGYGRLIVGADGALERIVEEKEATAAEKATTFCNSGVMCIDGARLWTWLDRIDDDNAKGEFYLTDIVAVARADGARTVAVAGDEAEMLGVNSRIDLAEAEASFQARAREAAMASGVTMTAPDTVTFAYDTRIGPDVVVEPHVVFAPGVTVERDARVRAFSHLEGCRVASGAVVGPYARLRPGADVGEGARVGNFVEIKAARLGQGAKVNHLSYVGDAEIGPGANVGAGTITCNYDGYQKHRTEIGAGAFIGSNSSLVAPVTIGARANVAAGSTITRDVPEDALALGRARQTEKPQHARRLREALAAAKSATSKRAETDKV